MGVLSNNVKSEGEIGWDEMIQKLLVIFQEDKDSVNIEEVEELLSRYR